MLRLVRFARVLLDADEETVVTFSLDDRCFKLFSAEGKVYKNLQKETKK
jgi:hypothetical protein